MNDISISYAILTHNEDKSLKQLLDFLIEHKDENDEIVILDDFSDNPKTIEILDFYVSAHNIVYEQRELLKDFANQKNYLTRMCKSSYIMNIDADEMLSKFFILAKPSALTNFLIVRIASCGFFGRFLNTVTPFIPVLPSLK